MNTKQLQPLSRRHFLQVLGLGAASTSLTCLPLLVQAQSATSNEVLEQNKDLERTFVERINARDVDGAMSLLDPKFINYDEPGRTRNLEDSRTFFTMLMSGFPDGQYTILDMVAEGDKVVRFMQGEGTHTGEFMGIPATGKRVSYLFIDIDRIVDGKIVEHWGVSDNLGMMQQLGMIPSQ
jgi:predicted ester cyclase